MTPKITKPTNGRVAVQPITINKPIAAPFILKDLAVSH